MPRKELMPISQTSAVSNLSGGISRLSQQNMQGSVNPFEATFRPIDLSSGVKESKREVASVSPEPKLMGKKRKAIDKKL